MHVRICPNCNSPDIVLDHAIWWGDRIYYCKRCHFRSSLFPEIVVKDARELKKLRLKPVRKNRGRRKGKAKSKINTQMKARV